MDIAYLAVEGGGSKARAALLHRDRLLARIESSGINPGDIGYREFERRLCSLVEPLLAGLKVGLGGSPRRSPVSVSACLALAGAGNLPVRRRCRAIAGRVIRRHVACRRLTLMTDAEALVRTYLNERDGVVLIAGTGSIAMGVRHRGGSGSGRTRSEARTRVVRVGGLGGLADAGSGFRVGMGLIEHALRVLDGTEPEGVAVPMLCRRYRITLKDVPSIFLPPERSRISSLAPTVLAAHRAGDPIAASIVAQAVCDLADLVGRAIKRAGLLDRFQVYLSGGLFASPTFRGQFVKQLRKLAPGAVPQFVAEPLVGVLALAKQPQVTTRPPEHTS